MMTEAEYVEYDRTHDGKYEYVNGEVVAMAGVSDAHDRVQVNATVALANRLRGGPCRVRGADLRIRLDETGLYWLDDWYQVDQRRVFRGGGWDLMSPEKLAIAHRDAARPDIKSVIVGFRCAYRCGAGAAPWPPAGSRSFAILRVAAAWPRRGRPQGAAP